MSPEEIRTKINEHERAIASLEAQLYMACNPYHGPDDYHFVALNYATKERCHLRSFEELFSFLKDTMGDKQVFLDYDGKEHLWDEISNEVCKIIISHLSSMSLKNIYHMDFGLCDNGNIITLTVWVECNLLDNYERIIRLTPKDRCDEDKQFLKDAEIRTLKFA